MKLILFTVLGLMVWEQTQALDIDFSRRNKKPQTLVSEDAGVDTAAVPTAKMGEFVSRARRERDWGNVDRQEIVILNTGRGFVPNNLRVRKGLHYLIHVVNVNKDNKNVSFMLDAFNQHHSTFYGDTKTFKLDPEKEGIFEFQCPETSAAGKLVVYGPSTSPAAKDRATASQE